MTIRAGTAKRPSQSLPTSGTSGEVGSVGADLEEIVGPPPILPGENEATYRSLYQRIRNAIEPADTIEEILARDVTDLSWEISRLRRLKEKLMTISAHSGLKHLLIVLKPEDASVLEHQWVRRQPKALKTVEQILAAAGLDSEAIWAQTLTVRLDDFERIDRMIMQKEARRNTALREVDRRRAAAAERLRNAIEDVTDVEIEEAPSVETPGPS
jgi:hypothetical protein